MSFLSRLLRNDPPGTEVKDYRETKTRDQYRIKFIPSSSGYRIEVLTCPRDRHGKGVHVNHKYPDGHICTSAPVTTLSKAKAIAIHWMTGWSGYVRSPHGKWPRNGTVRINVPD